MADMPSSAGIPSFEEYYQANGGNPDARQYGLSGYDLGSRIRNWFTGEVDSSKQKYDRMVEEANLASARAFDTWFDSTKYQRAVADLKKAGLNPWLAVQNGLSGSSDHIASTSNSSSKHSAKEYGRNGDKGQTAKNLVSSAAAILAILAML